MSTSAAWSHDPRNILLTPPRSGFSGASLASAQRPLVRDRSEVFFAWVMYSSSSNIRSAASISSKLPLLDQFHKLECAYPSSSQPSAINRHPVDDGPSPSMILVSVPAGPIVAPQPSQRPVA